MLGDHTFFEALALALSLTFGFPMQVVCCRQYVLALLLPPALADAPLPRTAVTVAIVGSALLLACVLTLDSTVRRAPRRRPAAARARRAPTSAAA